MEERPELTKRQQQVYAFIEEKIEEWGYPPVLVFMKSQGG